jgi:hypothetical protein
MTPDVTEGESLAVQTAAGTPKGAHHSKTPKDKPSEEQLQTSFDRFWAVYPKKAAKQVALKAWEKLAPDDGLLEAIIRAIERAKETRQWQRESGCFIPHPATFLNQGRWEDEPVPKLSHEGREVRDLGIDV